MSRQSAEFRSLAAAELARAAEATLPNVRALALRAAERWTDMADRQERVDAEHELRQAASRTRRP